MSEVTERIFNRGFIHREVWTAWGFLGLATCALPIAAFWLGFRLGGLGLANGLFLAAAALGIYVSVDRALLVFNQGLRERVRERLQRLAEWPAEFAEDDTFFVGLAYPERKSPRRLEPDDDVGFLGVTETGLLYRGDGLQFNAEAADLAAVRLRPMSYGLGLFGIREIEIEFHDEEPFRRIILHSRQGPRLSCNNRLTHRLYQRLAGLCPRTAPVPHLAEAVTEAEETLTVERET
jgi:hypothetical protein